MNQSHTIENMTFQNTLGRNQACEDTCSLSPIRSTNVKKSPRVDLEQDIREGTEVQYGFQITHENGKGLEWACESNLVEPSLANSYDRDWVNTRLKESLASTHE